MTTTVILIVSAVIITLLLLGYLRLSRRIKVSEETAAQLKDRIDVQELISDEPEPDPPERPFLRVIRGGRGMVLAPLVWLLERVRARPVRTAAMASTAGLVAAAVVFSPSGEAWLHPEHSQWMPPAVLASDPGDAGLPHTPDQLTVEVDLVVPVPAPVPDPAQPDLQDSPDEDVRPPSSDDPPITPRPHQGLDTEESAPDQESPRDTPDETPIPPAAEQPSSPEPETPPDVEPEPEPEPEPDDECLVEVIIDGRVVQIDICVDPPDPPGLP